MRNTYAQDQEIPLHYSECPSCGDRRGLPAGDGEIPLYTAIGVRSQGRESNPYWFAWRPILVTVSTYIETVVAESCALFIVLRHRASSSPICLSEVIRFSLRLIARIPLIQRREKCPSREEKSAFPQWLFRIYVRSLKDQVRKSKYPRT